MIVRSAQATSTLPHRCRIAASTPRGVAGNTSPSPKTQETHQSGSTPALGADVTFQNCVKATKLGSTISNVGYHGEGAFVHLPRVEWGVGMAEKTVTTGLSPGGRLRMERLLRLLERDRVDPTLMTTHTFAVDEMDRSFEIMDKKPDGVLKPLIVFA